LLGSAALILSLCGLGQAGDISTPNRANTFSIVALDPETGELGIAVQSKIVGVGAIVPWAEAGVGAVATQSLANVRYGPIALQLLRLGTDPEEVVKIMTDADPHKEMRQLGIVSAKGRSAAYTGLACDDAALHLVGEGYAIQGNLLAGESVITAMEEAFLKSKGALGARLLAALEAGQNAGGDRRGKQSACLLVVKDGWGYAGLNDRFRDIRVDDHEHPIQELIRIYKLHQEMFPRPE
tara:strand:- start:4007 stop:4720 length:714 start_codon:yes stop_codon:yes gene_type:complete